MRVEHIGRATLYCGDCLDILPDVPEFGHVIVDPPYMLKCSSDKSCKLNPWADLLNGAVFIAQWMRLCMDKMPKPGAMWSFCNWRSVPAFMRAGYMTGQTMESLLVWDKKHMRLGSQLRPRYELVGFYPVNGYQVVDRAATDIHAVPWPSTTPHDHPAEKPEALLDWLVHLSGTEGSICDPFMGSGTTGVAALRAGRDFIGIEMDERWFDVACRRLEKIEQRLTI